MTVFQVSEPLYTSYLANPFALGTLALILVRMQLKQQVPWAAIPSHSFLRAAPLCGSLPK